MLKKNFEIIFKKFQIQNMHSEFKIDLINDILASKKCIVGIIWIEKNGYQQLIDLE